MIVKDLELQVMAALADDRFRWRTRKGVAQQVGVPESFVAEVIASNGGTVIHSSVPSADGDDLFTTRDHFRQTTGPLEKLLGAFKGRIR